LSGIVIDASVAIKWVVEEEGTAQALALRHRPLAAPDLIMCECANILWKKVRRNELSTEEAAFAGRLLANADIDLIPTRPLMDAAIEIAVLLDRPAYDCLYLALAERNDMTFVTADSRLIAKGRTHDRFRRRFADLV
jgi:predicted nucleic acid-binding protein